MKGQRSIKGLLLAHGEKVVIGVVAICAVIFVWKSMSLETLPPEQQADRLAQLVSATQNRINNEFSWDEAPVEEIRRFPGQLGGNEAEVPHEAYQIPEGGWNRPIVPPTVLRSDPALLVAQDLEVAGGSGLIALIDEKLLKQRQLEVAAEEARKQQEQEREQERQREQDQEETRRRGQRGPDEGREPDADLTIRPLAGSARPAGVSLQGDEKIIVAYWATVLAKVPAKEQANRYKDILENSRSYNVARDYPEYLGYVVERAEVDNPGQELRWERADVRTPDRVRVSPANPSEAAFDKVSEDWGELPDEVVADMYYHPALLFPLASLVGRDWGAEVNHSDLPLAWEIREEADPTEETVEESADDEQMMFGPRAPGAVLERGAGPRSRGGGGMRSMRRSRGGIDGEQGAGHVGPGRGGFGQRVEEPPYYVLRFFDFNVEPGKRYKYRVRLALTDVNHPDRVNRNFLDQAVWERLNKAKQAVGGGHIPTYRLSDWSEPSPTVSIPLAGIVHVAEARPANPDRHNDEPRINVLVESFGIPDDEDQPVQAAIEKEVFRGSVLNMKEKTEYLTHEGRSIKKTKDPFIFHTDVTVVDIDGGEKLTRDLGMPSRALLMDPSGRLFIRKELEDTEYIEHHRDLFAPSERGRRDGGGGEMERGEFRGPEGF